MCSMPRQQLKMRNLFRFASVAVGEETMETLVIRTRECVKTHPPRSRFYYIIIFYEMIFK